jgi:predicted nucleotidyltransferase
MGSAATGTKSVARWLRDGLPRLLRARGVDTAYVFGSWARGQADAWSDIDLILVAESTRPFVDRFRDYPELLRGPGGIDLLVYTPAEFARVRRTNRFVRHVMREARRVI